MQMNCNREGYSMKKKLLYLISVMILITAVGTLMITLSTKNGDAQIVKSKDKIKVVTTFYPVYMIGLNLADQLDGIEVNSLTDLNTGCLHDYQLTTEDMKLISVADIMIINGGGMESFLEDIRINYPELVIIDASEDISLISSKDEHTIGEDIEGSITEGTVVVNTSSEGEVTGDSIEGNKDDKVHNEEEVNEDQESSYDEGIHDEDEENAVKDSVDAVELHDEEDGDHDDHDHGEFNSHVWLNPKLYIQQIENVRDGLNKYLDMNKHAELSDAISENAKQYINDILEIDREIEVILQESRNTTALANTTKKIVVFHDAFTYLADRAGIDVAFTVPLDADTALSAGDIAKIIDEVKEDNIKYLFIEQQYSDSIAKQISAETGAVVKIIDSVVTGEGSKDSYLKAMRDNLIVLEEALME
jgi:zinc transport system substrate-binding protein